MKKTKITCIFLFSIFILHGQETFRDTSHIREVSEEMVSIALGLQRESKTLVYPVPRVVAEDLSSFPYSNLTNALHSKFPGVNIRSSSGSPGASAAIRIRGHRSIMGSNNPLIILDGIPIDNSEWENGVGGVDQSNRLIDINPFDIESVNVLKGPAAMALYGIRGANGAIVLNSKSVKHSKLRTIISSSISFEEINKLPERQSVYAQGRPVSGHPIWRGPHTGEGFSWGPLIKDLEFDGSEYDYDMNGQLIERVLGSNQAAKAYDPYTFFI
ncbi:MAG: TonB-dependent receptor plug domain-containing protein, partial [Bacteroidetes bacterium]|nr:TonB-dependent receptor plug domain-containing protein [Bacteroidota bacterium]